MPTNEQPVDPKKLLAALTSIDRSLTHLSAVARAPHIYGTSDLSNWFKQYAELRKAEATSMATLEASKTNDNLSFEQRVEKFGKDEADRQTAPLMAAMDARRAALANLSAFQKEHPLIVSIADGTRSEE